MDEEVVDSDVAGATADTLNWSMSAISCGEENKNHYVVTPSDLSPASSEASLDNVNDNRPPLEIPESMNDLLNELRNLSGSRQTGSGFVFGAGTSSEPVFRDLSAIEATEATEGEEEKTRQETTAIHRTPNRGDTVRSPPHNSTPPVRDCGPGEVPDAAQPDDAKSEGPPPAMQPPAEESLQSSAKKIEQMRSVLRDLEKRARSSSASRIPRRSIKFPSSTENATVSGGGGGSETTAADNSRLKAELETARSNCEQLRAVNQDLEARLAQALELNARKEQAFLTIKQQWTLMSQKLMVERDTAFERQTSAMKEKEALKQEMAEAKKQIAVCENEMGRALGLLSDFRHKAENEERVNARLASEIAQERKITMEQKRKLLQVEQDREKLQIVLREQKEATDSVLEMERSAKEDCERRLSRLTSALERETQVTASLKQELETAKKSGADLHDFYQTQIESILGDKVTEMQGHILQLESNFLAEKDAAVKAAIKRLEEERAGHSDDLRMALSEISRQKSSLESSLKAARTEADCLREQLKNADLLNEPMSLPWPLATAPTRATDRESNLIETSGFAGGSLSTLEEGKKNNALNTLLKVQNVFGQRPDIKRPTTAAGDTVLNNHRPMFKSLESELTGPAEQRTDNVATAAEISSSTTNSALLTQEEKEEVIRQFMRQFLEANPTAALDASLMTGLNSMACAMAQQSFRMSPTSSWLETSPDAKK